MSATAAQQAPPVNYEPIGPMARLAQFQQDPKFLDMVWQRVIEGQSLGQMATSLGLPKTKFIRWISDEHLEEYERALRMGADEYAHDLVEIADKSDPEEAAKTKLRIEARRWLASRWDKGRYGEHTKVEHTGSVGLISLLASIPPEEVPALPEKTVEALPVPADGG